MGFERLPTHVRPTKYTLEYTHLDLDACLFAGNVSIDVVIAAGTRETSITVHALDLWIRSATLRSSNSSSGKCMLLSVMLCTISPSRAMRQNNNTQWVFHTSAS
jgi:hypothetical protein